MAGKNQRSMRLIPHQSSHLFRPGREKHQLITSKIVGIRQPLDEVQASPVHIKIQ